MIGSVSGTHRRRAPQPPAPGRAGRIARWVLVLLFAALALWQAPSALGAQGGAGAGSGAASQTVDVEWNGFINGSNALAGDATPTGSTAPSWTRSLLTDDERASQAWASASDPLIADGKVYIVSGATTFGLGAPSSTVSRARLQVLDAQTGALVRERELDRPQDSTCRPVCTDGMLIIPLAEGYLQAVSATSLETLWSAQGLPGNQALSTLTLDGEYVYVASACSPAASAPARSGAIRRFNARTGALAGSYANESAGYYWAGGIMVAGRYVVGDEGGDVVSWTADLTSSSSVHISDAPIRSTLVADGGAIYAVSNDGVLHRLSIASDGAPSETGSVSFCALSTSTPTVSDGRAYIGGSLPGYKGVLAIVDLSTMSVQSITQVDGEPLPAEVKSAPLVSVQGEDTYVYFTSNFADGYPDYTTGGCIYLYRLGDEQATTLFQPGEGCVNYCMASVATDDRGDLFYTNDSGNLFAFKGSFTPDPDPTPTPDPDPTPDPAPAPDPTPDPAPTPTPDTDSAPDPNPTPSSQPAPPSVPASDLVASPDADATGDVASGAQTSSPGGSGTDRGDSAGPAVDHDGDGRGSPLGSRDDGAKARSGTGASRRSANREEALNPWAIAGIALGVLGLVGICAYLALAARSGGSA